MEHWYALYTKPRKEVQVSETLKYKGIETYLPLYEPRRGRQRHNRPRPLFACYLFAKLDLSSGKVSSIRWTPGLRRIVSFDGEPAIIQDGVVSAIKKRVAQSANIWLGGDFEPGERVRIKSGPLRDFEAIFDERLSSFERVRVFLDILGRLRACQIEIDRLGKMTSSGRP